jgi:iron(III) transport system substrate-binding protein
MRIALIASIFGVFNFLYPSTTTAQERFDHLSPIEGQSELIIYGTLSNYTISPILKSYQQKKPQTSIYYYEFSTDELYQFFLDNPEKRPDIMVSSAMDLQFKLVNDGFATKHRSTTTDAMPEWSRWRNEMFGFTFEPIVIAINTDILTGDPLPETRDQLINFINRKDFLLEGKVGLSDIEKNGLGFLTWSQDSQQSRTYGRLLETFGRNHAKLFSSSNTMLQALTKGDIFIAYNVLSSQAEIWAAQHPWIVTVLPNDYTTVVIRTAFISNTTDNLIEARTFLDFLLSSDGQNTIADQTSLLPILVNNKNGNGVDELRKKTSSLLRPISISLELLLQTDDAKRKILFEEWRQIMNRKVVQ